MGNTKVAILFAVRRVSDSKREFESSNFVRTVISLRRPALAIEGPIADFAPLAAASTCRPLMPKWSFYNVFAWPVPTDFFDDEIESERIYKPRERGKSEACVTIIRQPVRVVFNKIGFPHTKINPNGLIKWTPYPWGQSPTALLFT